MRQLNRHRTVAEPGECASLLAPDGRRWGHRVRWVHQIGQGPNRILRKRVVHDINEQFFDRRRKAHFLLAV